MEPFELLEPDNLSEALSMLNKMRSNARIIAGGQSLLPMLKHRQISPEFLITIKDLPELGYIRSEKDNLHIGALATHSEVEASETVRQRFPVLFEMEQRLGCVQTRNWGTLMGNICHSSPN